MALRIIYGRTAIKDLQAIPLPDRDRIRSRVAAYAAAPAGAGHDVRALVNHSATLRLRVGDWRVVFDVLGDDMAIKRVLHRREAYR